MGDEGVIGLAGRRVVLTGASRGIGRACALRLAGGGARILAVARGGEALEALDALAGEAAELPGRIVPYPGDVTDETGAEALAEEAGKRLGGVDALVNNAGAAVFREIEALSPENFDATLAVCLKAPYLLTRSLAPLLEESGGDVINISSIAAVDGFAGGAAYCAAKAGLEGLSRALVQELRPRGIRVTILRPGATATRMWEGIPGEFDASKMIPPGVVAESLEYVLTLSREAWTETLVLYPPGGKV
ncbi:MAG TPA: SDR family oxidoreductase [Nitrospinota bacterium]|nr:SDR family oxidoreductase [Nitrospinota bacterium]MDP7369311.1 SDR family oxidoreductase [Nitrospinota bacterium]MDP7503653.1 SDR family oxidoreductase [Nitrospinota bacterium]MDP7664246.1 SDR family oxidoreductase [Nitrospinota bacterium]HJP15195.1 SDR family oxidoreductase [Nitrospinota bacterium]